VSAPAAARARVLVVDDEPTIGEVVSRYLERAGYETHVANSGKGALSYAQHESPDLVVLDLMLPDIDGLEVMRRLRQGEHRHVAIILLTARAEESDRIVGLRLGADDYVVKPFSPGELVARADALLRRLEPASVDRPPLEFDGLRIDLRARTVTVGGEPVALTQREYELLAFLAQNAGRTFTRDELMESVWQFTFFTDTSTVTVHVRRLRAKIESDPRTPRYIQTAWGVGYRFQA
jgi:DNA-binding response OmpR family regulator